MFSLALTSECLAVCLVNAVNKGAGGEIGNVPVSSGKGLLQVISADEISTTALRVDALTRYWMLREDPETSGFHHAGGQRPDQ